MCLLKCDPRRWRQGGVGCGERDGGGGGREGRGGEGVLKRFPLTLEMQLNPAWPSLIRGIFFSLFFFSLPV